MKKIVLSLFLFAFLIGAKAQFTHSAGATLFLASPSSGSSTTAWGVTYSPRYCFNPSFSVGVPLSLGLASSGSYNSREGASGSSSITLQLPVMVDYNLGLGSSESADDDNFGFYAGLGFGYFATSYSDVVTDSYGNSIGGSGTLKATGPLGHAGIRFKFRDNNMDLGVSFHKGLSEEKASIIGITLLYGF